MNEETKNTDNQHAKSSSTHLVETSEKSCSDDSNKYAIEAIDIVKEFDDGQVQALKKVNLRVLKGKYLAITGPSGSGKSTLMHIISTLDKPTSGIVKINGKDTRKIRDLHILRAKTIGFIFQLHNLIPSLSLVDNVMIPLAPLRIPLKEKRERALKALEEVGLSHRITHVPPKVSGGERQRAAFARALVNKPEIILGDEPTGNVDTKTGEMLMNLLLKIKQENSTTLIIVTHNPEIATLADHQIEILDGNIASESFK